jgi:hypothetical protein
MDDFRLETHGYHGYRFAGKMVYNRYAAAETITMVILDDSKAKINHPYGFMVYNTLW